MDRKEFLSAVGISAVAFAALSCAGCSKSSDSGASSGVNGATGVDFTLDLSAGANASLLSNGGHVVSNSIIVARTNAGAYIAVQQSCTHQNYPLAYEPGNQRFYCNNHGATFNEKGVVTGGPTNRSLTVYKTTLTGTSLRVYS
ncbi:Rieske 2Fe-2S domain-containing protein [Inquilinus sp. KBS0705]|nr:Rieske 2Fe-2S domain-containing protein [Inquilinus sp. KBS0705]